MRNTPTLILAVKRRETPYTHLYPHCYPDIEGVLRGASLEVWQLTDLYEGIRIPERVRRVFQLSFLADKRLATDQHFSPGNVHKMAIRTLFHFT